MRRGTVLLCAAALGLGLVSAPAAAAPAPHRGPDPLPAVYPVPHSMRPRGGPVLLGESVAVVTAAGTDAAALRVTRTVLRRAGVDRIDRVSDPAAAPPGETEIYLGRPAANPATARALADLGVTGARDLPGGGYVLATGTTGGHRAVVLDGHDATGTFYAAQTLRQLVRHTGASSRVPGVVVRDRPTYPVRGVIEGFYGTPWSHAARLSQLDFYGAHKMNTYVYSPKDDPYLRAKWRQEYPPGKLADLKELVDEAKANHVRFTYALSPGLSVCYSSAADEQALLAKFQSLWDIGVRHFAVPLDDISYTDWNCAGDKEKFGTGGAAAGSAQAYLLNEVQRDFVATHPGAGRLEMVPTEYADVDPSGYKNALDTRLDPAIVVEWTGVGVIAPTITRSQAAAAKRVFGHDILLWDNYPVNDYTTGRLLLGPYVGRQAGMSDSLVGVTANPMIQAEASKIALFTVADFAWNDAAYDPRASWKASLGEFAGGDPAARAALAAFADLEHYSRIDKAQAPVLRGRIDAFWRAWKAGDSSAAGTLDRYLRVIASAQSVLGKRLHDPAFLAETKPWLDATTAWGDAARAAVRYLVDTRHGDTGAAAADRERAQRQVRKAKSYDYVGLDGKAVPVEVGDGVLDTFISQALT